MLPACRGAQRFLAPPADGFLLDYDARLPRDSDVPLRSPYAVGFVFQHTSCRLSDFPVRLCSLYAVCLAQSLMPSAACKKTKREGRNFTIGVDNGRKGCYNFARI